MGNILRRGVDMYKQTINMKNEPEPVPPPESRTNVPKSGGEFIKTSKKSGGETPQEAPAESKYRRVAKFLILIGSEQAAGILAELDPEMVQAISKEITLIKTIKPEEGKEILEEFHSLLSGNYRLSGLPRGGIEAARRILYAAKGPQKGEALLNKAVPESRENLFSFLEEFSPEQLAMVLKTETAQTMALILSRLPHKLSA